MSNLAITCIRDLGNKSAPDIIDPLFTDISVMVERARNLFNEFESNRILSTNLLPLKEFSMPTSLVAISDLEEGVYFAHLRSTEINITMSDSSIQMDTTLSTERLMP